MWLTSDTASCLLALMTTAESKLACTCEQIWGKLGKDILLRVQLRIGIIGIALEGNALPDRHALWRIDGINLIMRSI